MTFVLQTLIMNHEQDSKNAVYASLNDSVFQLTLSPANKAEIFAPALTRLDATHSESLSILRTISEWNPDIAALFTTRSSASVIATPFRLIYPTSALPSFGETGLYVRQYVAISYCWRSKDSSPATHGLWPVSKPFVDAILSDLDHPREGIWMDQLCIDQSSSDEKRLCVAAMNVVYHSCIRQLILLEDAFLTEAEAALHEKYDAVTREMDGPWVPENPEEEQSFKGFYKKVNAARWWKRAWCFHEIMVSEPWSEKRQRNMIHNATFVLNVEGGGTVKIKWVNLQLLMTSSLYLFAGKLSDTLAEFKGEAIFAGVQRGDRDHWRKSLMAENNGWRSSIMARHNGITVKDSTFLSDRLSVMINMCGLGLAYTGPELRSTEELLFLASIIALAAGESYPLTMMPRQRLTLEDEPTWLAHSTTATDTSIPRFALGSVKHIQSITSTTIKLDMIFLTAGWEQPSSDNIQPTYTVLPSTIPTIQPRTVHSSHSQHAYSKQVHPDTTLDLIRRRFLASCIHSGPIFTARLWKQLQHDVIEPNYNTGVFLDLEPSQDMVLPAHHLLAALFPISIKILSLPPPACFTLQDAQLFLTWLADPRSIYYMCMYTYRIPLSPNTKADVGAYALCTNQSMNQAFSEGPESEIVAAIPVDLVGTNCMHPRLWFLRPGKEEGRWRIVGKGLMLGEPEFGEDLSGVRRGVGVVVGG